MAVVQVNWNIEYGLKTVTSLLFRLKMGRVKLAALKEESIETTDEMKMLTKSLNWDLRRTNGFVVWSTFITLESKPVLNFNQHVRLLNKDCYVHGYIVPHGGSVNEFLSFYICPTTHLSRAMMMMMRHCDSVVVTFTSYRWYRALLSPLLVFK